MPLDGQLKLEPSEFTQQPKDESHKTDGLGCRHHSNPNTA